MFILLIEQKNEPRKLTRSADFLTQHFSIKNGKNCGTRFAQTALFLPFFLLNVTKNPMPRFAVYHPFYMFNLVRYVLYRTTQMLIIKNI